MIDDMFAPRISLRAARSVFFGLLFCMAMALAFTGCGAPPMKTSGDADGAPVEHKVFYEGWGWKKSE